MSRPALKTRNSLPNSALKNLSLSLGVTVLLVGNGATPAFSSTLNNTSGILTQLLETPTRSNVRIPPTQDPQADDPSQPTASGPRFACENRNGKYTVMYYPESQEGQGYTWATPTALGGGWTPEARCNEISRRLEAYRPDGLQELRTAIENNYNTICVTTEANPACRIVLTVPPGEDPRQIRDRVFENLTVADSGQQTDAVNTFVGGGRDGQILRDVLGVDPSVLGGGRPNRQRVSPDAINLRPFLDPKDGGTGSKLRNNRTSPSGRQLNPNIFR